MKEYDVIVIGAGSAGCMAALSSAREGASTLLIEETMIIGGTNTQSLVGPIVPFLGEDGTQIVDGIPQEIIDELISMNASLGHIPDPIGFANSLTPVDFKALQLVLSNKLNAEVNLDILLNTSLIGVSVDNQKITSITTCDTFGKEMIFTAKSYIDCSGDADLVRYAGGKYTVGRESDNLSQPMTMCFNLDHVDLEQVRKDVYNNPGNFALSDELVKNPIMDYVAISGYFDEVRNSKDFPIDRDRLLFFQGVREDEVGVNTTRILNKSSLSKDEMNKAQLEGYQQVSDLYKWLVKNIPAFKNAQLKDIGVIGVRESVHIVGRKQLTDEDVIYGRKQDNPVATGCYPIDIHSPDSKVMEYVENNKPKNFEIDLDMLRPVNLDNVYVAGRSLSATHSAHAAARVSATCMAMGESIGRIAAKNS